MADPLVPALSLLRLVAATLRDLVPIVVVVVFFQVPVLRQPFPEPEAVTVGLVLVMLGLALFLRGLEMALFPVGEAMAEAFARKGSLAWLLAFAFALGFGTTLAEPALITVADQAASSMAEAAFIADTPGARAWHAVALRYTVAAAVGVALMLGVFRILRGWPLHRVIIGGYVLALALTALAPQEIVGIAYDSGGVTTSTVTVPLVTALGIGLATVIRGRNPLIDGFGLIAFASLTPVLGVLVYGMLV
jgi:hypothetical protein